MITTSILTVITPAPSQDLVSLATVRDELQSKASDNAYLTRIKRQASSAIASYCDRVFITETVSEQFRGRGPIFAFLGSGQYLGYLADGASTPHSDPVTLRRFPVVSITSITEDGVVLAAGVDYELDAARGFINRLWNDMQRPWDFDKLVVEYSAGYAADAVPDDLQDAALRLITARYAARGRDPMLRQYSVPGVLEETFWVGAVGDNGAMPPEVAGLIDQYREVRA
jgi:hypothetical protein